MTQYRTDSRRGSIADALIGVWTLRQYYDFTEGLPLHYPFGDNPEGLLIYTADGFVSAVLMARGRPNLSGNGFMDGTPGSIQGSRHGLYRILGEV